MHKLSSQYAARACSAVDGGQLDKGMGTMASDAMYTSRNSCSTQPPIQPLEFSQSRQHFA